MDKFLTHLFEKANLWKVFAVSFIVSFGLTFTMFSVMMTPEVELSTWAVFLPPLLIGLLLGSILPLFIRMYREQTKFYNFADEIEEMITDGDPFEGEEEAIYTKIRELDNMAYHRVMGGRVRELCKMYELKYDKKILKR